MRWFKRSKKTHQTGNLRIKQRYLWFPIKIKNEIRWLEWTGIVERYQVYNIEEYSMFGTKVAHYTIGKWEKHGFFSQREIDSATVINVDDDDPYCNP